MEQAQPSTLDEHAHPGPHDRVSRTDEPPPSDPRSLEDTLHDADPDAAPVGEEAKLSRYLTIERLGAGAMGV